MISHYVYIDIQTEFQTCVSKYNRIEGRNNEFYDNSWTLQ